MDIGKNGVAPYESYLKLDPNNNIPKSCSFHRLPMERRSQISLHLYSLPSARCFVRRSEGEQLVLVISPAQILKMCMAFVSKGSKSLSANSHPGSLINMCCYVNTECSKSEKLRFWLVFISANVTRRWGILYHYLAQEFRLEKCDLQLICRIRLKGADLFL